MSATAANAELAIQAKSAVARSEGYWAGVWKRVKRDPVTIACASVLLTMLIVIVFAPLFAPHDPFQGSMMRRLRPLGTDNHLLGTDELGRDMLTRLIYGGRLSWFMGIVPVAMAFVIGPGHGIVRSSTELTALTSAAVPQTNISSAR